MTHPDTDRLQRLQLDLLIARARIRELEEQLAVTS